MKVILSIYINKYLSWSLQQAMFQPNFGSNSTIVPALYVVNYMYCVLIVFLDGIYYPTWNTVDLSVVLNDNKT